ncbi:hypothetical protein ABPG75_000322 [Micractinium tetrahymenae]
MSKPFCPLRSENKTLSLSLHQRSLHCPPDCAVQVLSTLSGVLRDLFRSQQEGGVAAGAQETDLSAAFQGSSLADAACLLHLMYGPHTASSGTFFRLSVAGRLLGVAGLAHKLDAAPVLARLGAHLQELAQRPLHFSLPTLLAALRVAQACQLAPAESRCLDAVAHSLAAGGSEPALLEAVDHSTLATLLVLLVDKARRLGGQQLPLPQVVDAVPYGGSSGGFTLRISGFGTAEEGYLLAEVASPWVDIGGFRWQLLVYPLGGQGAAHNLSAYLELDTQHALEAGVQDVGVRFSIAVIDQRTIGNTAIKSTSSPCVFPDKYNERCGRADFMPLRELRAPSRGYLAGGQLLVRAEVIVVGTEPAGSDAYT